MTNFLPFKERTEVAFSTNPTKNITLVIAENNVGKSSLLKAFIWCLYNSNKVDKNVLNAETQYDLLMGRTGNTARTEVEILLSHEGYEYIIHRDCKFTVTEAKRLSREQHFHILQLDKYGNETPIEQTKCEELIKRMLPEDLSEYFFYEERKFAEIGKTKKIKQSVEDFCGLTKLCNALEHIKKAKSVLSIDGIGTVDLTNNKLLKFTSDLMSIKENIDIYTAESENAENEIQYFSKKINETNADIIAHSADEEKQKQYRDEANHLAILKKDYSNYENGTVKAFNNDPISYLESLPIFQDTISFLEKADHGSDVESIPGVTTKTINEIIRRGRCICGAKIIEGSEQYHHLEAEKCKVPPNSVSDLAREYKTKLESAKNSSQNYVENVRDAYANLKNQKAAINNLEDYIEGLEASVNGTVQVEQLREKQHDFQSKLHRKREQKSNADMNLARLNANKERDEEQVRILSKKNSRYNLVQKQIFYLDAVKSELDEELKEKQKSTLEKMNVYVSDYFNKIYHGNRQLSIDENYEIQISNKYKDSEVNTELSTGTNDVKNFAFVFGLEQIAKSILNKDEIETNNLEAYPLILDGPFSHVDGGHIENLCEILPSISNQIIIAVSAKDWNITKKYLEDKIGIAYEMTHITEENTVIKQREQ